MSSLFKEEGQPAGLTSPWEWPFLNSLAPALGRVFSLTESLQLYDIGGVLEQCRVPMA